MDCNATIVFQLYEAQRARPVEGARVTLRARQSGEDRTLVTNSSGRTQEVCAEAPDKELSLTPEAPQTPYALYDAEITADGYIPAVIEGMQVFEGIRTIQELELSPVPAGARVVPERYIIGENALRSDEPRRPEAPPENARILTEVFIPRYITVHLGAPNNTAAQNVTVSFVDYIKNVASSEIYPTWPENALRANIFAQISFALNRIFTEWYPSRGYSFNITNNTAFDQAYVNGRNIYENISELVDSIFNRYIRRQGNLNPLFASYCNGTSVTCAGLSQWGSLSLAQQGYTPINILRYYFGANIELVSADTTRVLTSSYPGSPLSVGSSGVSVAAVQTQLNRVRRNYPAIPVISSVDGIFGAETRAAVRAFQSIFNLTADGVVGRATWNKLSYIYSAVLGLAELQGEGVPLPSQPPRTVLRRGSSGDEVRLAQYMLAVVSKYYDSVRAPAIDGSFGSGTQAAVTDFQRSFGLTQDGIIGPDTWNSLYSVYIGIADSSGLIVEYPGTLLRVGSTGANVRIVQDYLNYIGRRFDIPALVPDGVFGTATREAVLAFQRLSGLTVDGVVGENTWNALMATRLLI